MLVTASVSDTVIAVRDKLIGKIGQTKVKRYWPGKAPEWADDADEDGEFRMSKAAAFPTHDSDIIRKDDPRPRRLAESRIINREDVTADHRRIRQAEIEGLETEEKDADAQEERRRKIREKDEEKVQEDEEEESEYDTDLDEELAGMVMLKPVFVPNSERDTIAERERLKAEEWALEESRKKKLEEWKREAKQIVVEEIRKDEEIQKGMELEGNIKDIDTDDEVNEAEEYEAWKAREIAQIKRDREDREATLKEKEEIERVRNMTGEEMREFMQKYYNKGAFFQSDADDYAATVGTDGIYTRDVSVKHFGRSGRTKWTHLVNEDTTDWNNPWTYNDPLRAKYNAKMAGMNVPIAKPKGSKKLKDWESR
ncbi:microfibrillar-associated protein 1-like [Pyrus ussuriensis x Pyrus communis]|uniref:Microfibrillar-associated protein 1-like n=1 Tax=Pyrus ussuriensis x Pyrus communis TaxID=2448454 RepID=A0A5N5F7Z8_9ROSA|nr:microfibrillar-associated protein 1-like [Pyrus ussuriensis x Pyrus communis]